MGNSQTFEYEGPAQKTDVTGVKLTVFYCTSWGYKAKADALINTLTTKCFTGLQAVATPGTPGQFDVKADGVEKPLHSKKGAGEGFVDTKEKMDKLVAAIAALKPKA